MSTQALSRRQKIRDYFNSAAPGWYQHTASLEEQEFNNRTINPVLDCIRKIGERGEKKTLHFLDAGCGVGYWTWEIFAQASRKGYLKPFEYVELWLSDLSTDMLDVADHIMNTNEKYKDLAKLVEKGRMGVRFLNMDLKNIDLVDNLPSFDFTFFHKVLSMFEYGSDAEETFSRLAKNTTFMLTAVKSKQYYLDQMVTYAKDRFDFAQKKTGYTQVKIPTGSTNLILRRLDNDNWIVNDDAKEGGKEFFEYTYDSTDLIYLYEQKNNFFVAPSYQENGMELVAVGKPVIALHPETDPLDTSVRQDWYPLIQVLGVKAEEYSRFFSGKPKVS